MGDSLAELLESRPHEGFRTRLRLVRGLADDLGIPAHVVGGTARDLLLERPLGDLDIVVEGDAARLASALAERLGCPWRLHRAFGTAEVLDSEIRTDLAAARREVYPHPGALPEVAPAGLEEDLARRDFTVNALAIRLGGDRHGDLTDLHGGLDDLAARRLEVLHPRSFLDDPTRILRGLRFESRLDFRFSSRTEELAREAVEQGGFVGLSGARWRHDLVPLLELEQPPLDRLGSLGILGALSPGQEPGGGSLARMAAAETTVEELSDVAVGAEALRWRLRLLALAWDLPKPARVALGERLDLGATERDLLVAGPPRVRRVASALAAMDLAPHAVEALLRPLAPEEMAFVAASGSSAATWVRRGLVELLPFELTIRGADLVENGVPPGPAVGWALEQTRRARLDGRVEAADELSHALALVDLGAAEKPG